MRSEEDACFVLFVPVFHEPRIVAVSDGPIFKILRHFIYIMYLCVLGDAHMS